MKPEQLGRELEAARRKADDALLHSIAVSMASFIAAIDSDSNRVTQYIEQRLAPLMSLLGIDFRVREVLERIRADGRKFGLMPNKSSTACKICRHARAYHREPDEFISDPAPSWLCAYPAHQDGSPCGCQGFTEPAF